MTEELQPHIQLSNDVGATYALLPGDPARVDRVACFLEEPRELAYNREYKSVCGTYKGIRVLVTSTGIGGASAGIAIEELHNIGVQTMIRIGSCGALQPQARIGDLIIAAGAVRNDGASQAYIEQGYPAIPDPHLLARTVATVDRLGYTNYCGPVRSHDSFYTDGEEAIDRFWSERGVLGSDMETAALFVIGRLRGVRTASLLNVVVEAAGSLEGGINEFVAQENASARGEERQITTALETVVADAKTLGLSIN